MRFTATTWRSLARRPWLAAAAVFAFATCNANAGVMLPWSQESGVASGINDSSIDSSSGAAIGTAIAVPFPNVCNQDDDREESRVAVTGFGRLPEGSGASGPGSGSNFSQTTQAAVKDAVTTHPVTLTFARWREIAPRLPLPPTDDLSRPPKAA